MSGEGEAERITAESLRERGSKTPLSDAKWIIGRLVAAGLLRTEGTDVLEAEAMEPRRLDQMLSVRLEPDLAIRLREVATERECSVSNLLREGALYVTGRTEGTDPHPENSRKTSYLQIVDDALKPYERGESRGDGIELAYLATSSIGAAYAIVNALVRADPLHAAAQAVIAIEPLAELEHEMSPPDAICIYCDETAEDGEAVQHADLCPWAALRAALTPEPPRP